MTEQAFVETVRRFVRERIGADVDADLDLLASRTMDSLVLVELFAFAETVSGRMLSLDFDVSRQACSIRNIYRALEPATT